MSHVVSLVLAVLVTASVVHAQSTSDAPSSEDLEPRTIGTRGTMMAGFAGYLNRFASTEQDFSTHYTAQVDIARFITNALVLRGGVAGSGQLGTEDDDDAAGHGAEALHAFVGAHYYFAPRSIVSPYAGGEYWAQVSRRAGGGSDSAVAIVGLQGSLSSRAGLFVEGGYGLGLSKGDEDDTVSRVIARVGVRVKF